ncbi:MAG: PAS domain S-box protein [Deltaproteobacteria bacterium]|nr:PAS domain S-box protein [Deltaproteobacteria bacterium]
MAPKTTRILLVEDNPGDARLIREMLAETRDRDFEIDWVTSLSQAITSLAGGGIDLVILDLGLPDSQGLDTFTRAYKHGSHVPFLVLTGHTDENLGITAVRQGAQDHLFKGEVTTGLLYRAIRYAIERKRSEAALEAERRKLFALLDSLPAVVNLKNSDYKTLFANRLFREVFGDPGDRHCYELIHGRNAPCEDCSAPEVLKTQVPKKKESPKPVNGRIFEFYNYPFFASDDSRLLLTLGIDITERKQAEAEIRLNEARLASLLRISQFSPTSIQELLDYALDEAIALTGSKIGSIYFYDETTQQFTLNTWSKDVMQECTIAEPQTIFQLEKTGIWGEAVRQARPIMVNDFQAPHPLKKGYPEGHAPLYKYLTIPVIGGNRIMAVVGVANKATDYDDADVRQLTLMMDTVWKIVERKRAEEDLRKSQERYRLLVDQIPAIVFKGYPDWSVDFFDDKVEELTGYPKADFDSRKVKWSDLIPEEDFDYAQRVFIDALKTDKSYVREHRIRRKDGEIRWVQCRGQIFCDADEKFIHTSGVTFDVTKHKQTEKALRESEERFRTIFEDAAIGINLTDLDGRIINCNLAMHKMIGYAPDELIGKTFMEITHPDDLEKSLDLFHDLVSGRLEHYQLEKRFLRTDGQYLWARITVSSVKESESASPYNIAMIEDITRRKEAEESFRHLTQELIRAQEQERHKISRELHDTVAQELAFLKIGLANFAKELSEEQAQEIEWNVKNLLEALQKSLDLLRSISYDLRPPDLDLGLVQALKLHCEEFTERTGINVDFLAAGIKSTQLDDDTVINLYRIVQEGLTNVWRHAQAVNVNIRLVASYPKIILRLEDDGQGFNVAEKKAPNQLDGRLGLLGMKERVALLGGKMRIDSQLKKGTKITIEVPWKGENFGPKEETSHR